MLTFGTGIGSALFIDGRLFPNTELGHMELNGMDAEKYASAHVKAVLNLDWRAWMDRVNVYLDRMQALLWPDLFILGGAISERFADFAPLLHCEAEVRPAHFGNQAGVLGAALAAAEADSSAAHADSAQQAARCRHDDLHGHVAPRARARRAQPRPGLSGL